MQQLFKGQLMWLQIMPLLELGSDLNAMGHGTLADRGTNQDTQMLTPAWLRS